MDQKPRIYAIKLAAVSPLYVQKAENKGRTKKEVDQIITWLTGYSAAQVKKLIADDADLEAFFTNAKLNKNAKLITGVVRRGKRWGRTLALLAELLNEPLRTRAAQLYDEGLRSAQRRW